MIITKTMSGNKKKLFKKTVILIHSLQVQVEGIYYRIQKDAK